MALSPRKSDSFEAKEPEKDTQSLAQVSEVDPANVRDEDAARPSEQVHRRLKSRHIQLIGIGGAIGTSLFVQIGFVLPHGGPGSLLIAFIFWSSVVLAVNNCLAEMVSWMPISSPFVRFCDRFVDPAFGFAAGLNFFVFLAVLVPFEITAFNLMLHFWTDKIPIEAVITFVLVCYTCLNVFAVRYYGESEFWLAIGKVLLALGLIVFTFITMVGGNSMHDAFGFRTWNSDKYPGTPFVEYITTGSLGRFVGFIACLIQASFTVCGPEYFSMTAGEAENPRHNLPRAYKAVFFRMATFFILGALCVGILVPYNDPDLAVALSNPRPGAGSSIYVMAMQKLHVSGLAHLVNVLIMFSVFSAGNSYVYCATRVLYGQALERKMPRFLTKCTKNGVPIYCVAVTIAISLLAFLGVSHNSAVVLDWFVLLVTAGQVLDYAFICVAYLRFYRALEVQGISRDSLPYRAPWQPYTTYYALFFTTIMPFVIGYPVFLPENWDVPTFIFSYAVLLLVPIFGIIWKLVHKTKIVRLSEVDFFNHERRMIDEYEAAHVASPPTTRAGRIVKLLLGF